MLLQVYWPNDDPQEIVYDVVRVKRLARTRGPVITTTLEVGFLPENVRYAAVELSRKNKPSIISFHTCVGDCVVRMFRAGS